MRVEIQIISRKAAEAETQRLGHNFSLRLSSLVEAEGSGIEPFLITDREFAGRSRPLAFNHTPVRVHELEKLDFFFRTGTLSRQNR
jgi:hypothetical protein